MHALHRHLSIQKRQGNSHACRHSQALVTWPACPVAHSSKGIHYNLLNIFWCLIWNSANCGATLSIYSILGGSYHESFQVLYSQSKCGTWKAVCFMINFRNHELYYDCLQELGELPGFEAKLDARSVLDMPEEKIDRILKNLSDGL